jgi:small ligand-binding sensory domain FIST
MTVNRSSANAAGAVGTGATWESALDGALAQAGEGIQGADLLLVFASHHFAADFPMLVQRAREVTAPRVLAGCSGQGIIATGREVEGEPAVAVLGVTMPGARVHAAHITQSQMDGCQTAENWHSLTGVPAERVNAWMILADPFRLDAEALIARLSTAYPGAPLVGGMASGDFNQRRTHVFINGRVHEEGAVLVAIGGGYTVRTVVAQGAEPIGDAWTITGAEGNFITSIGGRPPLDVLTDTVRSLPSQMQERARSNLLIGLAMNEYKAEFGRGDFLIRNLLGAHRETGALAVGDLPRLGQTVQFQVRDAQAADDDLRSMLMDERRTAGGSAPVAALLCSCNGRGAGLFGAPDHDAAAVAEHLGPLPLAGFFCNGEIGPVGGRPYLHGFTASIGLIVPMDAES